MQKKQKVIIVLAFFMLMIGLTFFGVAFQKSNKQITTKNNANLLAPLSSDNIFNFSYTGSYQEFIVPKDGYYKIELWGAGASYSSKGNGAGGYTKGVIALKKDEILYVYVGESGEKVLNVTSFNAGTSNGDGYPAGGATDIRLKSGPWDNITSLASRIMVAGGGGTGGSAYVGGSAGGLIGRQGTQPSKGGGGTQIAGGIGASYSSGTFGIGGGGNAGGGGYYGGGGAGGSGGGGSSYISGHVGSIAIKSETDVTPKKDCLSETTDKKCSIHYSNKVFNDTKMIDGNGYNWTNVIGSQEQMPKTDGTFYDLGEANYTNGSAKISFERIFDSNNDLVDLTVDKGMLSPTFDKNVLDYSINLTTETDVVDINATLAYENATVTGLGKYFVPANSSVKQITVTAEDGTIKIYNLNFYRPASTDNTLKNIKINGINIPGFNSAINNYEFNTVTNVDLEISVEKNHNNQNIIGVGNYKFNTLPIAHNIVVTAEDGSTNIYTIQFNKKITSGTELVYLTDLSITPGYFSPHFVKDITQYFLVLSNEENYIVTAKTDLVGATIGGTGTYSTVVGKKNHNVTVTSKTGDVVLYNIEIRNYRRDFELNNSYHEYTVPSDGIYKIELWGAGNSSGSGRGAYTAGDVELKAGQKLYFYVGGNKTGSNGIYGGYNGGGNTYYYAGTMGGGNGATDVRLVNGDWNDANSLISRIMVAGGAGGGNSGGYGSDRGYGEAGGLSGYGGQASGYVGYGGYGGTQVAGGVRPSSWSGSNGGQKAGTFGTGGAGGRSSSNGAGGGGGGGYYGGSGASGANSGAWTGGGGSSYISGHTGAVAPTSETNATPKTGCTTGNTNNSCSIHPSNLYFTNTKIIDGKGYNWTNVKGNLTTYVDPDGSTVTAHNGEGYARIYPLQLVGEDATLSKLEIKRSDNNDIVKLDKIFDPFIFEYDIKLDKSISNFNIDAISYDTKALISGAGDIIVPTGKTSYNVLVTSENGNIHIYKLNFDIPKTFVDSETYVYDYSGNYQTFVAPANGYYMIQLWGAGGVTAAVANTTGGLGGYTKGSIYLTKGQTIYIYVGQNNTVLNSTSFNGSPSASNGYPGGGATDIRLASGAWNNFDSLKSRIMIAGGGGSCTQTNNIGYGGGLAGGDSTQGKGGTQTAGGLGEARASAGTFGIGGTVCGGGGGYFGGGGSWNTSGGGGSSYISGYDGSIAILESSLSGNMQFSSDSIHYSGLKFNNAYMVDGKSSMPNPVTGIGTKGNSGFGKAMITKMSDDLVDDYEFSYLGEPQEFKVPKTGLYEVELWGASGSPASAGKGAYTKGVAYLHEGETFYLYVGQGDATGTTSFNGGTASNKAGGGATDIRLVKGSWNSLNSLTSRIMVAGGGGGAYTTSYSGGAAGGLTGYRGQNVNATYSGGRGGTQTAPGEKDYASYANAEFGIGGGGNGGGGGWYGGGAGGYGGGGGSSYISGHPGSIGIKSATDITPPDNCVEPTTDVNCSLHYSGYSFFDTKMLDGKEVMPTPNGTTQTGNTGNGYARIKMLNAAVDDPSLESLTIDKGILSPNFKSDVLEYNLKLNKNEEVINISAKPLYSYTLIDGLGKHEVKNGDKIQLISTSVNGSIMVYNINIEREKSDSAILNSIKINDKIIDGFKSNVFNYTLTVEYNDPFVLSVEKNHAFQTISDLNIKLNSGINKVKVEVTAEDGVTKNVYILNIYKKHSTRLKELNLKDLEYNYTPSFNPNVLEYNLDVPKSVKSIVVDAIAEDSNATIKVTGNGYLILGENVITITVSAENVEDSVYLIKVNKLNQDGISNNFRYTGEPQEFIAPLNGKYKIQLWGAAGGGAANLVGLGGYTEGEITLQKNDILYIYVGRSGKAVINSWNGGGTAYSTIAGAGGGATDIRLIKGNWNNIDGLKSRIMVASGGGGNNQARAVFGHAGGLKGYDFYDTAYSGYKSYGGNQTAGGKVVNFSSGYANGTPGGFGYGGNGGGAAGGGSAGGGGGYYGGGGGPRLSSGNWGAGGGSSYISGHTGSVAIKSLTDQTPKTGCATGTTDNECSIHYSNKVFSNTVMIDGKGISWTNVASIAKPMPNPDGGFFSVGKGNSGNGFASITLMELPSTNANLSSIVLDKGTLNENFSPEKTDYTVNLGPNDTKININGIKEDNNANVLGNGDHYIPAGTSTVTLTVTSSSGTTKNYNITFTRTASNEVSLLDIKINGLIPALCAKENNGCVLQPHDFTSNTYTYQMSVPSSISMIEFVTTKNHYYQTVSGDGVQLLNIGENKIEITVTAENNETIKYTYIINRNEPNNTNIASLKMFAGTTEVLLTPEFNSNNTDYMATINNEYDSVSFDVTLEDSTTTYEIFNNTNLAVGQNNILIRTKSNKNVTKDYVIIVNRLGSSNNYIKSLTLTDQNLTNVVYTPTFNKFIRNYSASVLSDVKYINIESILDDPNASIAGNGTFEVKSGLNTYYLTVTSEDSSVGIYVINITKARSKDNSIKELNVLEGNLTPTFDSDILEYNIDVDNTVKNLNMNVLLNDSFATYMVSGNSNFKFGNNVVKIIVTAESGDIKTYIINVNKLASTNNNLKTLTVDKGVLSPVFDKNVLEYDVSVSKDIDKITINASAESIYAQITGVGTYALKVGENTFKVIVTSEDGNTKEYTIRVNRSKSDDATLLNILHNINGATLTPEFNSNHTNYTMNVQTEIESVVLLPIKSDSNATIVGAGRIDLNKGSNEVNVVVTAEDGVTSKTYTINIVRDLSTDDDLLSMFIHEGVYKPKFDQTIIEYEIKIPYEYTSITVDAITEDPNATYEILNNKDLEVGIPKDIIVRVIAEAGPSYIKDYTVKVTRQEAATTSNYLLNLTTNRGQITPSFNKFNYVYDLEVENSIKDITISATKEDINAKIEGIGTYNLKPGQNIISVLVYDENNIERAYHIRVNRKYSDDARLRILNTSFGAFNPIFNSNVFEYNITVPSTAFTLPLSVVPLEDDATYNIIGNENFVIGANQVIVKVMAPDKVSTLDYVINVTKLGSSNTYLKNIVLSDGSLIPAFNRSIMTYNVLVGSDINSINIQALPEDATSKVTGDGLIELNKGDNLVKISVTSESGTVRTYNLNIKREGSKNNFLKELFTNIGTISPTFDKNVNNYNLTVANNITSINIDGLVEGEGANVLGFGTKNLNVGLNIFNIVVTSEYGTINTYVLNIIREEIISTKLTALSVLEGTIDPEFMKNDTEYFVNIPNEKNKLTINYTKEDPNAIVEIIGNDNLIVGLNTVTIKVTRNDLETNYILTVYRQISSNNYLDYLAVSNGSLSPKFDKTVGSYNVSVDNTISNITISGAAESDSSLVKGMGTYSLNVGINKISIKVESALGIEREYVLNVTRLASSDNNLDSLTVSNGTTVLPLLPLFNKNQTSYTINVGTNVNSVDVSAKASSLNSIITGDGPHILNKDINIVDVVVTAEDGSIKTYKITINKETSDNNFLTALIPSDGVLSPDFDYFETNYTVNVKGLVDKISFVVNTEDGNATVTGAEETSLEYGVNNIVITVTAENGAVRNIYITVNRDEDFDTRLKNLVVNGYTISPTFDSDTYVYNVVVDSKINQISNTLITAETIDLDATITMPELIILEPNKVTPLEIVVTSENKENTASYIINFSKNVNNISTLDNLRVIGYSFDKVFDKNTFDYTINVPTSRTSISKTDIVYLLSDFGATITMPDTYSLIGVANPVYSIKVTSNDGKSSTTYNIHIKRTLSNNSYLKSIDITPFNLNETFSKTRLNYTASVQDTNIDIKALSEDTKAIVTGAGIVSLKEGLNEIEITVTAEDGSVRIYKLAITSQTSDETLLKNIEIKGYNADCDYTNTCILDKEFNENELLYNLVVPNTQSELEFIATTKDAYQNVTGDGIVSLEFGLNTHQVVVTSRSGQVVYYTYLIERLASTNNNLANLVVNNAKTPIDFNKDVISYDVDINYDVNNLDLTIELEDDLATYEVVGNENLKEGINQVLIIVTAQDNSSKIYTLNVNKSRAVNSLLKELTVSKDTTIYNLSPKFSKNVNNYVVNVANDIDNVLVNAVVDMPLSNVTGSGIVNLKTGSNIVQLVVTSELGDINTYQINIIRAKSTNAYLANIEVNNATLNEIFDREIYNYTVSVNNDATSLELNPTPEDANAKVNISGNSNLKVGVNTIKIIVIAEIGSPIKTYTLTVTKAASSNNNLLNITTNRGDLLEPFDKDKLDYTIKVGNDINSITIAATKESAYATITGVGTHGLVIGDNLINLVVTAQDGSKKTYTVKVIKEADSNNNLLSISNNRGVLNPEFDKDTLNYTINVQYEITDITIIGIAESSKSVITGAGTSALNTGNNLRTITVTAENGDVKNYKINVIRDKSVNDDLSYLFVHEGKLTPIFNETIVNYNIKIPNDYNRLTIDATPEDKNATVQILGNSNLKVGNNIVTVRVTAEKGPTYYKDYILNVERQAAEDYSNFLTDLTVNKGTLSPSFDMLTYVYDVTVGYGDVDITINAIRHSPDAKIEGTGIQPLKLGMNIIPITVTSKDGKERIYTVRVYRQKSNDARIKSISIDEGLLNPVFNRDNYDYTINVNSDITGLHGVFETVEPESTFVIDGNSGFTTGVNLVKVIVTAPDGFTKKTYTLTVIKNASNKNTLTNLTTSEGVLSPTFDKTNNGPYIVNVDNSISSILIDGVLEDEKATVTGLGVYELKTGNNEIKITVTSEAGTSRIYTVIVKKSGNSNYTLNSLEVIPGVMDPVFDPYNNDYLVTVENDVENIDIKAVADDLNATISGIGNKALTVGENYFAITVTAENGNTNVYNITVLRKSLVSSKLKSLTTSNGILIPDFNPDNLDYNINVSNEVLKLDLVVETLDINATYKIIGNDNFEVGHNEVLIEVTDSKKISTTTYKINVNRQIFADNFLKSLTVDQGVLSPSFNQMVTSYTVNVLNNVDSITVDGQALSAASNVEGLGTYNLNIGNNLIKVVVTSGSLVERIYAINVIREASDDNYLKDLKLLVDGVETPISPLFDKDSSNYTATVLENTKNIEIVANANSNTSTVTGAGIKSIVVGDNDFVITVISEKGVLRTYNLKVNRIVSTNANVSDIIPSNGTLTPAFNNDITDYEVNVDANTSIIDFEVILESASATVTGNENIAINYGANNVMIVVTAEDGVTTKTYNIKVNRIKPLEDIILNKYSTLLTIGQIETITLEFVPNDATNKDVIWESEDPNIATVDNGIITAMGFGTTNIKVTSVENPTISKNVLVSIVNLKLISKNFTINRNNDLEYIIGMKDQNILSSFLESFDNDQKYIKFYDVNLNEITDLTNYVSTGIIVKLEIDGITHDEIRAIVKGDLNGDGLINAVDIPILVAHVSRTAVQTGYVIYAMDVDEPGENMLVNAVDIGKVVGYAAKIINSFDA